MSRDPAPVAAAAQASATEPTRAECDPNEEEAAGGDSFDLLKARLARGHSERMTAGGGRLRLAGTLRALSAGTGTGSASFVPTPTPTPGTHATDTNAGLAPPRAVEKTAAEAPASTAPRNAAGSGSSAARARQLMVAPRSAFGVAWGAALRHGQGGAPNKGKGRGGSSGAARGKRTGYDAASSSDEEIGRAGLGRKKVRKG